MFDYETLRLIWWAILGVLLIGFAIMDGFDLGVGAIFRFVGRTDEERRVLLETVEPVWEGNQVWFILGGGAAFAAWPLLYAASFSGLYLALFLVLIALILRPVGFTFRGQVDDARWRNVWDWALFAGGAVPALLFGVAFGNLLLGIPFYFDELRRPVYTAGFFNLLHPFALLTGIVSLAMLVMHGATYAALKIDRSLASRAAAVGRAAALFLIVVFVLAGIWIAMGIDGHRIVSEINGAGPSNPLSKNVEVMSGGWLENYRAHALLWVVPGLALALALVTERLLSAGRFGWAFGSSALTVACVILTAGIAMFPFLMPSSVQPDHGLTIWDASSSAKTLGIMLVAVIVFLPIVLAYTSWVFRILRGEVTLEHVRRQSGLY
jgi:cytochrome d ubiquinol oxidase subunit II